MRFKTGRWVLGAASALLVCGAAWPVVPRMDLGVGVWNHDATGTLTSDDPSLQVPASMTISTERELYERFGFRIGDRWWAPTFRIRNTDLTAEGSSFVDDSAFVGPVLVNLDTTATRTKIDFSNLEGLLYFTVGSTIRAEVGGGLKKLDAEIETVQVNNTSGGSTTTTSRREFPENIRVFYGAVHAEPADWLTFGAEVIGGSEAGTELTDMSFRFVVKPWTWLGVEAGYRRMTVEGQGVNNTDFDFEFGGPFAGLAFVYGTPEPPESADAAAAGAAEPTVDSDNDGVPDGVDECPSSPQGAIVDGRGCPESTAASDADSDGIADAQDQCAETPAGAPVDGGGCLQGDKDQDGVADEKDECPGAAGALDTAGCPMRAATVQEPVPAADEDDDGVPNGRDRCPSTVHGLKVDASGCALAGESSVLQGVTFQKNSSYLMRDSQVLLMSVVASLKAQRTMKVEIQGHTCDIGDSKYNQWLSQRRANRVLEYLVRQGIDARRLTAVGYGESQPLIPNDDESMRELNRRTVFKVISQ